MKVSVPSVEGVLELVGRGLGVSVLPRVLLRQLGPSQQIAIVELAETWAQRHLLVCRAPEPGTAMAAALFSAFTTQWVALEASLAG